jgi:hypothetical protein
VGIPTSRNPNTPKGLESRLSVRIYKILAELLHSTDQSSENSVEPERILAELPRSSYEEGSQQGYEEGSGPQRITTLLTRLQLATTLRMRALQVESPKYGVCSDFHRYGGYL